jgi:hypothetical protein
MPNIQKYISFIIIKLTVKYLDLKISMSKKKNINVKGWQIGSSGRACLPGKREALSSNSSTNKKKKEKKVKVKERLI